MKSKNEETLEQKREEEESIRQEIGSLVSALDSPVSSIGDWKVVKIYEARLTGEEDPYDYEELAVQRQEARDRINELQAQLAELQK